MRSWAAALLAHTLYLAAVTILELEIGVLLRQRKDAAQAAVLRERVDSVRAAFAGRLLVFTETTALRCAPLHVPDPKPDPKPEPEPEPEPERDAVIAATALEHGFTVVTRNVGDYVRTGVALVNPCES